MISLSDLKKFKAEGRKFSCLTCYDASMAKAMELAEIDTILTCYSRRYGLPYCGSASW